MWQFLLSIHALTVEYPQDLTGACVNNSTPFDIADTTKSALNDISYVLDFEKIRVKFTSED